jgi:hypothetical protein
MHPADEESVKKRRKTRKTKFTSDHTDLGPVTAAQKLAELMCERQANKAGKRLPDQFWNTKDWKGQFMANKLLKSYPADVLFRVMASLPHVFSLRGAFLTKYFDIEKKKSEDGVVLEVKEGDEKPRRSTAKDEGILSKLEALDGA